MALSATQQFFSALEQSEHPLILLPENPSGDVLAAGYALALFCEEKDAEVAYVSSFSPVYTLDFLPKPAIRHDLAGVKDFVLMFDTSRNPIENVRTERENGALKIYLTPQKGGIDPRDFSFIPANMKYDCAFLLGARDKESLGKLYEENADILFEIPLVNIDVSNKNERFAQTNIVDVTASSVSELLATLLLESEGGRVSEKAARCLLAGIMLGTDSFRSNATTPRTFQSAASLIEAGADQQEIVRHLYKTQPLHILKLFGRVLEKLQWEESSGLAWAMVDIEDFVQSRSEPKDIPAVLERIRSHYDSAQCLLVLYRKKRGSFAGMLYAKHSTLYEKLTSSLSGSVRGEYFVFDSDQEFSEDFIDTLSRVVREA